MKTFVLVLLEWHCHSWLKCVEW